MSKGKSPQGTNLNSPGWRATQGEFRQKAPTLKGSNNGSVRLPGSTLSGLHLTPLATVGFAPRCCAQPPAIHVGPLRGQEKISFGSGEKLVRHAPLPHWSLFDAVRVARIGFPLLPSIMTQKSNASMGCQAATENQTQKNAAALVPIAFVMAAAWINPLQSSLVFSHPGFRAGEWREPHRYYQNCG